MSSDESVILRAIVIDDSGMFLNFATASFDSIHSATIFRAGKIISTASALGFFFLQLAKQYEG